MSKFTPGPWKVTHNGYANAPYLIHHVESGTDVAEVYCDESPDQPTQTANARLIAAAPEMLDALIFCMQELRQYDNANSPDGPMEEARLFAIKIAKEAIKKAGGE